LALHVRDVGYALHDRPLFDGIAFSLFAGDALQIVGENGVGKSTLLQVLLDFLQRSFGCIECLPDSDTPLKQQSHWIGHSDGLKGTLTALENLAFAQTMLGTPWHSPRAALEAWGIGAVSDVWVKELSAGQRRRVALARLLVSARPFWFLDEPLTALDKASQDVLHAHCARHQAWGGIVIAATHAPLQFDKSETLMLSPL
jgi:heme exporter protein A